MPKRKSPRRVKGGAILRSGRDTHQPPKYVSVKRALPGIRHSRVDSVEYRKAKRQAASMAASFQKMMRARKRQQVGSKEPKRKSSKKRKPKRKSSKKKRKKKSSRKKKK